MRSDTLAAVLLASIVLSIQSAPAQTAATRNIPANLRLDPRPPLPVGTGQSPAPDWLVWSTFYDSLEFYEKKSPGSVARLLQARAGLGGQRASAFRTLGLQYQTELARIDEEAKLEVTERYFSNVPSLAPPSSQRTAPQRAAGHTTKDGRDFYAALEADGVLKAVEQRKMGAIQAHRRGIAKELGETSLSKIEELLRTEVAPAVKVVTRAEPAPLPRGAEVRRPALEQQITR